MLFDLRSRGRRRTVQVIYVGLALLIGVGLVGFGVGTGGGGGGLFGGLTGNGSSNGSGAVNAQTKSAVKQTDQHPGSAAAWASLVSARYSAANSAGFDSNTSTYTQTGRNQLALLTQAYVRYQHLIANPGSDTAYFAARAYGQLGQYADASAAWQAVVAGQPGDAKALECVAMTAYAAKATRVGALAESQVLTKVAKAERVGIKSEIDSAKKSPSVAAQSC